MPKQKKQTVSAFRIVAPRWADTAFSGEGARKFGGRWNSPSRSMVYLGCSRSLCALEMLVHLTTPASRQKPYLIIEAHIPASSIADYQSSALPSGWRDHPPGKLTKEIGDDWIDAGKHLALRIPSVIIPEESNLLLNPVHPDFDHIEFSTPTPFSFDQRLTQ